MGDGRLRAIAQVAAGSDIYGTAGRGPARRYVRTRVLAHWSVVKPAYRIVLHDGTELTAGADHRFLTVRGGKFVAAAQEPDAAGRSGLTSADELLDTGQFAAPIEQDRDYRQGYLCGLIGAGAAEACGAGGDEAVLLRVREYLADQRLWAGEQRFANDPRFGSRMRGEGPLAELLRARFQVACRRAGLQSARGVPLAVSLFRPPQAGGQLTLAL